MIDMMFGNLLLPSRFLIIKDILLLTITIINPAEIENIGNSSIK